MDANTFQARAMRCERLMYHISISMLGDSGDCCDAVREALVRAWQKRDTLRKADAFQPWLMRILTNTCKAMLRRQKKRRLVPPGRDTAMAEPPQAPLPFEEAVATLSPVMRAAVELHDLNGYTIREMAAMLHAPADAVQARLLYARKRLCTLLGEEWEAQV